MQSSGVSHEAKRHAHQEAVARLVISGATLNPGKELHGHHDERCFMEISAAQGHSRALG